MNNKRLVKKIHNALRDDIGDLETWRAMPTAGLSMIDPFLFLNHHGLQFYQSHNRGLPFGPHPHRGFQTVTFIIEGDIAHRDSGGHESVINAGGVQWMKAGRGLVHEEISSDEFKKSGGKLEILQLWVNLPAKLKMTDPFYKGLQKEDIPIIEDQSGKVRIQLVSGALDTRQGPFNSETDVRCMTIQLRSGSHTELTVKEDRNIFFYVVRGSVHVNGVEANKRQTVDFSHEGENIIIAATEDSLILFCDAVPYNEPVVSYGPFVMNTREEINEAIQDYQNGKF